MTEKTWKIRDQLPNGQWSDEREVTLAQFRAEIAAKSKAAIEIYNRDAARVAYVEVDKETAYGSSVRLSRSIRVF